MAAQPPVPDNFKNLIPGPASNLCEKIAKLFVGLPTEVYNWIAYEFNEDGSLTDDYKALICGLNCGGGGVGSGGNNPDNPLMPKPDVSASDGAFSDRVKVDWTAVTPPSGVDAVTQYKVYRAADGVTDPNSSSLIATVSAPTLTYDDTLVVPGTFYNYWVVATNGAQNSAYGGYNRGNAGTATTTLDAISDLRCTKGWYPAGGFSQNFVNLVFTPPSGATKYDIYRNTTNDFSTAAKIEGDVVPASTAALSSSAHCWDNDGEIAYRDTVPNLSTVYYYWVVAKKDSPPAVSLESNTDTGWAVTFDGTYNETSVRMERGDTLTQGVDFSGLHMRVVLFGSGGGGAGSGGTYGGGGGGGGGIVIEEFVLSPGDVISLTASPAVDETGSASPHTDGAAGADVIFQINGVTKMTANGGGGGLYSSSGGGAGGAAGSGSGTASPTIYNGKAGGASSGSAGGKSGYPLGGRRWPGAGFPGDPSYNGANADAGSGAWADISTLGDPGGDCTTGFATVAFGA